MCNQAKLYIAFHTIRLECTTFSFFHSEFLFLLIYRIAQTHFFLPFVIYNGKVYRLHRHVLNIFWTEYIKSLYTSVSIIFFILLGLPILSVSLSLPWILLCIGLYTCTVHNNSDSLRSFDYKCCVMCWKMKLLQNLAHAASE